MLLIPFSGVKIYIMKFNNLFKNRRNIIPALIALLFILYGGIVTSYHHHENGRIKDECPICRLQQYGNNAVTVEYITVIEPLQFVINHIFIPDQSPVKPFIFSNARPHAPPCYS